MKFHGYPSVVVVGWTFIGHLLYIQGVGLHLSHYMKFYDTVHGYNTIPVNTGGAFPNRLEKKRVASVVPAGGVERLLFFGSSGLL